MTESGTSSNNERMSGESATRHLLVAVLAQQGQRSPPGALFESGTGAKLRGLETAGGLVLTRSHPRRALVIDVLDDAVQRGPKGSPDGGKVVALPGLEET